MSEILVVTSAYARPPFFLFEFEVKNSVGYGSESQTLTLRFVLRQMNHLGVAKSKNLDRSFLC